jgi:transposase InsO family protein
MAPAPGEGDPTWFLDRSHAPEHCPHRTDAAMVATIVALRRRFPHCGPRKLLAMLERKAPWQDWPAASTIGDILKRAGLVEAIRRRRPALNQARPVMATAAANDEWCADFKGWFRTGDQRRVDPLTITDNHSRFVLAIKITAPTMAGAKPVFTAAFTTYGLPLAIRCDNGSPFGSRGAGGLTRLSAWWLKLGIRPHFIHPASPQENGRHERMHRTLKNRPHRRRQRMSASSSDALTSSSVTSMRSVPTKP